MIWTSRCGAVLLALLAAAAWAADAPPAPPPPAVTVSPPVQREIVEWDEYTGQFAAVEYVELRARVSGYLEKINFQDGQLVNKGDLLFVIDPRPFEISLASAKASLAQARARLDLATKQVSRAGALREKDFVAASTFDERNAEMHGAAGAVEASQAAIQAAELDLVFSRIMAPVAGRVGRHEVSVGNLVTGGNTGQTTLLTTIVSLDPIYFDFDMSEAAYLAYQRAIAAGRLKSAQDSKLGIYVKLADEKDWPHKGEMQSVDNAVDRGAGTIRARAVLPNPGLLLTPGQFGRLRLPGSDLYQATLIPDSAVVTDQSQKVVMTVSADGTVVPKPIRPGPMVDGLRVVRDGLKPDDRVIIRGLVRARAGAKVTAQAGEIKPE